MKLMLLVTSCFLIIYLSMPVMECTLVLYGTRPTSPVLLSRLSRPIYPLVLSRRLTGSIPAQYSRLLETPGGSSRYVRRIRPVLVCNQRQVSSIGNMNGECWWEFIEEIIDLLLDFFNNFFNFNNIVNSSVNNNGNNIAARPLQPRTQRSSYYN